MYVGGVRCGEPAVMKCMRGERWGEHWWLKPPHAALFPTWLPAVVHRTNGAQLDLTERDASRKRQNRQGEVLRPNPAPYICLSAHISCLSFLSARRKLHISCCKKCSSCVSVLRVWSHRHFGLFSIKQLGWWVSCCLGSSSCTRSFWCVLDNSRVKCLIILCLFPKKCLYSSIYVTSEYSHGLVNHVKTVNSPLNHCKHALTHHRLLRRVLKNADVLESVLYSFTYSVPSNTVSMLPSAGIHIPPEAKMFQQVPNYQRCISLTRPG